MIDSTQGKLKFMVSCISRIKKGTTAWNFYTGEDIEDGAIVFAGVTRFLSDPSGFLPNDEIAGVNLVRGVDDGCFLFEVLIGNADSHSDFTALTYHVVASDVYLEDPRFPDKILR